MTIPFNDAQVRFLLQSIQQHPPPIDGIDGPQGEPGPEGPQGPDGTVGPQGATGPQGVVGAGGIPGPTGAQGNDGTAGEDGAVGPQGATGSNGATGPRGPRGPQGFDGPQGAAGRNGSSGASGVGVQGSQGPQGADGGGGSGNAFEPYGPDLVTGDNQTFEASLGDWTNSGGTLLWTDVGVVFHPTNRASTHVLDFTPDSSGDYAELTIPGTFLAGVPYVALLSVEENTGDENGWELELGIVGVDSGSVGPLRFFTGLYAQAHLASVIWTPSADRTDPVLRVRYPDSGTPNLYVGWCKVAELREAAAFRSLDITEGRGSWMRFQDRHFTIVNEDFLVHAVDVVEITSDEDFRLINTDGDIIIDADSLRVENITTDGTLSVTSEGDDVTLNAAANVNLVATNNVTLNAANAIALFDATPGLVITDRPTIDPTAETGTVQLLVQALIALGVVIDGTP